MIELTIVGITITMLIAIALPNFIEAQIRATVTASSADMAVIASALEEYYIEHRAYPPNVRGPEGEIPYPGNDNAAERYAALTVLTTPTEYLFRLPLDPFYTKDSSTVPFYSNDKSTVAYDYVNFVDATGSTLSRSEIVGEENGRVAYILVGNAPDQMRSLDFETMPPTSLQYSPTNGTRSTGDIILFGP